MRKHKIAKALGVRVMELRLIPDHYQDEASMILQAEFEARMEIAGELGIRPHQVVLPEF